MGTGTGGNVANVKTVIFTSHDPAKPTAITTNALTRRLAVADDIVTRLREFDSWGYLGERLSAEAADEIERLRAAGDALAAEANYYTTINHESDYGDWEEDQPQLIAVIAAWEEARRG